MKTRLSAANIAAFIIGALALIGAIALTSLHDTVPGYLWAIALAGVSAGAGLSVPTSTTISTDFAGVAEVLPQLVADLNKAVPGAVKVEDVAAEILRQVAASSSTSTSAPAAAVPAQASAPATSPVIGTLGSS